MDQKGSILDQYRETKSGDGWHTAPDDGYLYDHLVSLLKDTDHTEEIHELFADDRWLHARVKHRGYAGYLQDLEVAWNISYEQALTQIESDIDHVAIVRCIRYALIATTINTIMNNYVPSLVEQALRTGLWTASHVQTIIDRVADPEQRTKLHQVMLAAGEHEPENGHNYQSAALADLDEVNYAPKSARLLVDLAPYLESENRDEALAGLLNQLLGLSTTETEDNPQHRFAMQDIHVRSNAVIELIPLLPDHLLESLLVQTSNLNDAYAKAWVLAHLASHLVPEKKERALKTAIDAATEITDEVKRANVLMRIASQVADGELDRVLDAVAAFREEKWRPRVLAVAAQSANDPQQQRILEMSRNIQDQWHRAYALSGVVPYLSDEQQERVLQEILGIEDEEGLSRSLSLVGPYLEGALLEKALAKARAMQRPEYRADALHSLIGQYPESMREPLKVELQEALSQISNPIALASRLAYTETDTVSAQLDEIAKIQDDEDKARSLVYLIPELPERLLPQALDVALSIDKVHERISYEWALDTLAPRLEGPLLARALADAANIADAAEKVQLLISLMPYLDSYNRQRLIEFAFQSIRTISAVGVRADVIADIVSYVDDIDIDHAFEFASEILSEFGSTEWPVRLLAVFAARLTGEAKTTVINRLRNQIHAYAARREESRNFWTQNYPHEPSPFQHDPTEITNLVTLATHVENPEREKLLDDALLQLEQMEDRATRMVALTSIIAQIDMRYFERLLAIASDDPQMQLELYIRLMNQLSEGHRQQAIGFVNELERPYDRVKLWIALLPYLDGEQRQKAIQYVLSVIPKIKYPYPAVLLYAQLIPFLEGDLRAQSIATGLDQAHQIEQDNLSRLALAQYLPLVDGRKQLINDILRGLLVQLASIKKNQTRDDFYTWCASLTDFSDFDDFAAPIAEQLFDILPNWTWATN